MARAFTLTAPRQAPESDLQAHVATMLRAYMPDEVWWTASLSGVPLSAMVAGQAKRAGMQKGAPDLSFVFPDGVTRYVELKSATGTLTPEQKALAVILAGGMAVCTTWTGVRIVLEGWMAPYGLRFLTDTESYRREGRRKAA